MFEEIKKVTFLSLLLPRELEADVRDKSSTMPDAGNALQWHIYSGLAPYIDRRLQIFNLLPVGSFPQYYKDAFIKSSLFKSSVRSDNVNIAFCNIKLIRNYFMYRAVYRALKKLYSANPPAPSGEWLMVYTLSAFFLKAAAKIKQQFPSLNICAVVADLPEFSNLSEKKSGLLRLYIKHKSRQSAEALGCVDKFVLLTAPMAEYLQIKKPFHVMEGISTKFPEAEILDSGKKIIMYSGTLHRRFGIMNLLNAFKEISGRDYRLIICGIGDAREDIELAALEDSRIDFRARLSREDVLKLQSQASLLVNPRQNNEEFTKYSFPSKNIEYLSSGIPVLAYKLDGIPDEYDKFLQYPKDNSVEALRDKIEEICSLPLERRRALGRAGQEFVMNQKNEQVQMKKVLEFLRS